MRYLKTLPLGLVFLSFLVLPALSFPEVKISLKNGREIIADRCRDTKDRLICQMSGGNFEIEKKDVVNLKEIQVRRTVRLPEGDAAGEKKAGEATVEPGINSGKRGEERRPYDSATEDTEERAIFSPERIDQPIRR